VPRFDSLLPVAEDCRHSLASRLADGVRVRGDAELLTQVFSNLVENAIRHTPELSKVEIKLAVDGGMVAASVVDDGPGDLSPGEFAQILGVLTSSRYAHLSPKQLVPQATDQAVDRFMPGPRPLERRLRRGEGDPDRG